MALTQTQKNNRKKLVTALRSGKYKQGRGLLRSNDNKFCCQGVACDIFPKGEWVTQGREDDDYAFIHDEYGGGNKSEWPQSIRESYGFTTADSDMLMVMNDMMKGDVVVISGTGHYTLQESCTFDEIADCIEYLTLAGI
jgi:hypothetical protein